MRKLFLPGVIVILLLTANACTRDPRNEIKADHRDLCTEFEKLVDDTYDFKPSKLTPAQQDVKSAKMDIVWKTVKDDPKSFLPCLRAAIASRTENTFFRFDASGLLIQYDQSADAKKILLQAYSEVDFKDIDLRYWMPYIAKFGYEGLDTTAAGDAWLRYPDPGYYLPEHGAVKIDKETGALIAYGSMDEAIATPALAKIAAIADHPGRETAVRLLMQQATPESFTELKNVDARGLSPRTTGDLKVLLTKPVLLAQREGPPKISRQKFLDACQQLIAGKSDLFIKMTSDSPDGERDAIAVMKEEDIPLVRKVRRFMMLSANQHSAEWYDSFTKILMAMVWKPETPLPEEK